MNEIRRHTAVNRRGWDEIGVDRPVRGPAFYRDGGSTLDDVEVEQLPDVSGRSMLHLACANGNDTLSWASRGAEVSGVDISEVAVAAARDQAAEAGFDDARFVAADMFELPGDLGTFDIVYASWGVVCWVPDLDLWMSTIASLLRPGGTFFLAEHHPVWEVLGVDDGRLKVTVDYFGRRTPSEQQPDATRRPVGWTEGTELTTVLWPISDVASAVERSGLRIRHFSEYPAAELYAGLGEAARWLPATYVIRATRQT